MTPRRAAGALLAGLALTAALELALRAYGFGDAVLARPDPALEYRLVPDQTRRRFGNLVRINAHGMRGPDHPAEAAPRERRVLMIGDSIVYGNHFLDQAETIPARLTALLAADPRLSGCRPLVMALAAGSWGPPNQAAALAETGPLGARVAVILLSAHDLYDAPAWVGIRSPYAEAPFATAIGDAARLAAEFGLARLGHGPNPDPALLRQEAEAGLERLGDALEAAGLRPLVVYHPTLPERRAAPRPQRAALLGWARGRGYPTLDLTDAIRSDAGYRDAIHPDPEGATAIAQALAPRVAALAPPCAE